MGALRTLGEQLVHWNLDCVFVTGTVMMAFLQVKDAFERSLRLTRLMRQQIPVKKHSIKHLCLVAITLVTSQVFFRLKTRFGVSPQQHLSLFSPFSRERFFQVRKSRKNVLSALLRLTSLCTLTEPSSSFSLLDYILTHTVCLRSFPLTLGPEVGMICRVRFPFIQFPQSHLSKWNVRLSLQRLLLDSALNSFSKLPRAVCVWLRSGFVNLSTSVQH